jgi:hypothetical protein
MFSSKTIYPMKPLKSTLMLIFILLCQAHPSWANRFWISNLASNWNNPANWSNVSGGAGGFSIPGPLDDVTFNGSGLGNCIIDAPVNVNNFTVAAAYTGTILQGVNSFLINNNASFSGGIFTGGTANISVLGNFTLNGTAFTSTSGVLQFAGNSAFSSGTFTHNNGRVKYDGSGASSITGTSPVFFILEFVGTGFNYNINSAGDITVMNNLSLSGASLYNLNNGIIDVNGDINVSNTAPGCGGTALVNIIGPGIQNFVGSTIAGDGALPQLTINKTSGTLNLSNFPGSSNNFTYTAGTVAAGTSTYCFTDGTPGTYTISGSLGLNNITFLALSNATFTINAATTLTANGNLSLAGTSRITLNTGSINVDGNISLTNTSGAGGGSATLSILGTTNQTVDGTAIAASQSILPYFVINKPSGTLTLKGNISVSQDWTYTSGAVDASTFASTVIFGGNGLNLTSAGMSFYNLTITGNTVFLINSLTVKNNLTLVAGHLTAGNNTINLSGNWSDYGSAGFNEGNSTVNLNGSALQTISSPGGENFNNLTLNNSATGIQLENNILVSTVLTMTQGNIDLNGNSLTLGTGAGAGNIGTLAYTSGSLINSGNFTRWFAKAAIAAGSNAGLFPMGSSLNVRPLYISAPIAPTTGGTVTLSYSDLSGTQIVSFPDGPFTVQVIKLLNWTMTTGNGLAGGNFSLDAQGTGLGTIGNVADLRLTLVGSAIGTAGVNAGTILDPQVNTTSLSVANLNNSFYIGSVNFATSDLPLTLVSFTASLVQQKAALQWETASETGPDFFTVQRSMDAVSWENFDRIPGNGSSDSLSQYQVTDPSPFSGRTFYRIMQTEWNGAQSFSEVKWVELQIPVSTIRIYPNPAAENLYIASSGTEPITVTLFSGDGQRIKVPSNYNGNQVTLSVTCLNAGIYFVRIDHPGFFETKKLLINR